MNYLTVTLFLALGATLSTAANLQDLYDALTTDDPFWMIVRTYKRPEEGRQNECVRSEQITWKNSHYELDQKYIKPDGTPDSVHLYVTIPQAQGEEPVLYVSEEKEKTGNKYTLRHWDRKDHCAIFTVDKSETTHCEMFVWNNYLKEPGVGYACDTVFDTICHGKEKNPVYKPSCRDRV